jgi:hypothetical protein
VFNKKKNQRVSKLLLWAVDFHQAIKQQNLTGVMGVSGFGL